jgi:hypothetical protein
VSREAQVAGIVISAIDYESFVAMRRIDVLMAAAMNAWNHGSAALAVHEVDCFPDAAAPCVLANCEGASQCVSSFDCISAGLAEFGKIQGLVCAQRSAWCFDRLGEDCLSRLLVDE